MIFIYNRFLRPISISDNNIQVLDNTGSVVYTINPFSVGTTKVSNNVLKISESNELFYRIRCDIN